MPAAATRIAIASNKPRRRRGEEGVVAAARIGACVARSADSNAPAKEGRPAAACAEADAVPVAVCASIPVRATTYEVAPHARFEGDSAPWPERRVPWSGQVRGKSSDARIGALPKERADTEGSKQVCVDVWSWDIERPLDVHLVVKYLLTESAAPAAPVAPTPAAPAAVQAAVGMSR